MSFAGRAIRALIFPPRCRGCHKLLPPIREEGAAPLCAECALHFEREMRIACKECNQPFAECRCQPKPMKEAGVICLLKLAPYGEGERHRVMRRMILDMKNATHPQLAAFLAAELEDQLRAEIAKAGFSPESCCITHLPRMPKRRRRAGTDQALVLARALSARVGIPHEKLFRRRANKKEQKHLKAAERVENLRDAFLLCGNVSGKLVITVDDLVTSGAGMSVIAKQLKAAGAAGVLAVSAAYTPRKK